MFDFTIEDVIDYHLNQIRRFGTGWRAPQVRQHRESVIALIHMRRDLRRLRTHQPVLTIPNMDVEPKL
jgi:hypothetical protein